MLTGSQSSLQMEVAHRVGWWLRLLSNQPVLLLSCGRILHCDEGADAMPERPASALHGRSCEAQFSCQVCAATAHSSCTAHLVACTKSRYATHEGTAMTRSRCKLSSAAALATQRNSHRLRATARGDTTMHAQHRSIAIAARPASEMQHLGNNKITASSCFLAGACKHGKM